MSSSTQKFERAKAVSSSSMIWEISMAVAAVTAATAADDREHGDWLPSIMTEGVLHAYVHDGRLP